MRPNPPWKRTRTHDIYYYSMYRVSYHENSPVGIYPSRQCNLNVLRFNSIERFGKIVKNLICCFIVFKTIQDRHFIQFIFIKILAIQHIIFVNLIIFNEFLVSRKFFYHLTIQLFDIISSVYIQYKFFLKNKNIINNHEVNEN